jgi:feruloyl-CoA hydratase/lyase
MSKSYEVILIEKSDGITFLRFNRPEKKNAMNPALHREMYDALSDLAFDDETKVLVLTGSGDSFSAGQDLKEYFYQLKDKAREEEEIRQISHGWRFQKLYHFPKPTIAMVNGWCFGGAFTAVASCDIAIAAEEAVFGLSEINFGNLPGGIVTKSVSDLMLPRQALYYALTGDKFDGKRACEIGFVTMAVPKSELLERTRAIANTLKAKDKHALRAVKDAFKAVDIHALHHEDSWYWLKARIGQLTMEQKDKNWVDHGIGKFLEGAYRPGLEAAPPSGS